MCQLVNASSIVERARRGDRIDVVGATITGNLDLSHGKYAALISIRDSQLEGLNLSFSHFADIVRLCGCRIAAAADLSSATFESELSLDSTTFCDDARFTNLDAARGLTANRARFSKSLDLKGADVGRYLLLADIETTGPFSLTRSHVDGCIDVSRSRFAAGGAFEQVSASADLLAADATFGANTDFARVNVGGQGLFANTRWAGDATFEGGKFGGDLSLEGAKVSGSFTAAVLDIKGDLNCERINFGGDCDLQGCQIDGDVILDGAVFTGEAKFIGLSSKGQAQFVGAHFCKETWFDMTSFDQGFFGENLRSEDKFQFRLVSVGMDLDITKASFGSEATFNRSSVKANIIAPDAVFEGSAEFVDTSVGAEANFTKCTFTKPGSTWDLRWSSFNVLHIDDELADVPPNNVRHRLCDTNIQTSGCKYNRLFAYWKPLLAAHTTSADLQPYTQLESVLQSQGFDDMAARVYYEGHKEVGNAILHGKDKSDFLKHWLIRVPLDLLWRFVGYGVNSKRLFWPVALFLILGFFAFSQPRSTCVTVAGQCVAVEAVPSWPEASWLTVRTFLPVDIPALDDRKASHEIIKPWGIALPADYYASLLRIAGWITVPVLIAALAGFLRRSGS